MEMYSLNLRNTTWIPLSLLDDFPVKRKSHLSVAEYFRVLHTHASSSSPLSSVTKDRRDEHL